MRERNPPMALRRQTIRSLVGIAMAAVFMASPTASVLGQSAAPAPEGAAVQDCFAGSIRLLLPPRIFAVPGIEMSVYFDNICLVVNRANYLFDVTCAKGTQQAERWTMLPTDADVGQYPWAVEVRDQENRIIARAESILHVVPQDAGAGVPVTFLTIGASETHAAVYPAHLLALCNAEGNPHLTLVGHTLCQKNPEVRIEGYGGWTAHRFMTHFKPEERPAGDVDWKVWNARGSPFLYSDGQGQFKADFAQYCREFNQGKAPDFVTITLGGNDTFRCTDETIDKTIDTMLTHFDGLIDMIRQVRKDTKIGAVLMYPPAAGQDAFGANYRCGMTYWQCKRNLHRAAERMIEHHGNREVESISLVPVKTNLDCQHNFPTVKAPWNAQTKAEGERLNNALHPAAEGYRQIGDTIYCWMKAQLVPAASSTQVKP
jgi:lysophospholipase L1-like esterase